jgi:hypothetical protein
MSTCPDYDLIEEMSVFACLEDAFRVLKAEGSPFLKNDVIALASEYRRNNPLGVPADSVEINLSVFSHATCDRMKELSRDIDEYTGHWFQTLKIERRSRVKRVRPKRVAIAKSARPA